MTRVATAANEPVLVGVALHGTAAHVEKLVRKYRWVERAVAARRAQVQHESRGLHYFFDDAGMLVVHGRLPPEVGAVVRKAIDAAAEELCAAEREGARDSAEASPFEIEQTAAAFRADALAHVAEHFLAHRGEGGSVADRYQVVVHVDQAVLTKAVVADDREPHCCELDDGPALALDTARRLRIHVLNLEAGLAIDSKTSRCRWLGESMDYSQAIEGMQFLRDRDVARTGSGASP